MSSLQGLSNLMIAVCGVLPLICGSGCAALFKEDAPPPRENPLLKPIVAPRDAIELEVHFVERRIGDPLIGNSLWGTLQEINSLSPETRDQLAADGFRFGMSPSRPPRALQSLITQSPDRETTGKSVSRKYTVPSGQETLLYVSEIPNQTPIVRKSRGVKETVEAMDARSVLRVKAERVDDGWTRLVITPEIRYGQDTMRAIPDNDQFLFRQGQKAMTFYEDVLSAELNIGEMVVLGLASDSPDSLAKHFFRSDVTRGTEMLILLRVSDMREVEAVPVTRN